MKSGLLILIILLEIQYCYPQTQSYVSVPNIMSPDVSSLGKYGSYNINYYTGVPNISIPLYEIKENGIDIPISLSYDAGGFIPNKNSGIVGLNWNLNAGGAITRIVNGVMDDKYDPNNNLSYGPSMGYMYEKLQTPDPNPKTSEQVRTLQFISDFNHPEYNSAYEYIPDIFSFNFLGHTGKFFMDNVGQIQVVGDRNYKVDLSNLKGQFDFNYLFNSLGASLNNLNTNLVSQIVLTSDDGFIFYFGGSLKTLEISLNIPTTTVPNGLSGTINAWYLTKVVTPEGNNINLSYRDYVTSDLTVIQHLCYNQNGAWVTTPADFLEHKFFRSETILGHNQDATTTGNIIYASVVKLAYLTEIKTNSQTIDFIYVAKDQNVSLALYDPAEYVNSTQVNQYVHNHYTLRLNNINIKDNFADPGDDAPFGKQITFSPTFYGRRMFLTGLDINPSSIHYGFSYLNTSNLPDPLTKGIDEWGYYNGVDANSNLVGQPSITSYDCDLSQTGHNRLPNPTYTIYGQLNTITYPTGGTSQFFFEGNIYGKILKKDVNASTSPSLQAGNGNAGGLRIQKIVNSPGVTTYYKYINDYDINPNGTTSSGILSKEGIPFFYYQSSAETTSWLYDNNIKSSASYSESQIGYKEVLEFNTDALNGFTKYKFTNYETNPDVYTLGNDSYYITPEYSVNHFNYQMTRVFHYSSKEDERGKLLSTQMFAPPATAGNPAVLKKSIDYTYNTDPLKENYKAIGGYLDFQYYNTAGNFIGVIQSYALYYYQNNVTKTIEKDYGSDAANPIIKTTSYSYKNNASQLLDQKTITRSNGDVIIDKYSYPQDFSTAPYTTMVTKNILSPVIEDKQTKGSTVIQDTKTNYGSFQSNTIFKPSSIVSIIGSGNPETKVTFGSYDNLGNLIPNSSYDNLGNLLSYSTDYNTNKSKSSTSYIWDYSQTFPVAKVNNAPADQIAYTSFEAAGKGNWAYTGIPAPDYTPTPTGFYSYTLNGSNDITKSSLPANTYIVSYWTKNSVAFPISGSTVKQGKKINGFTYFEHKITFASTGTVTIHGTGVIDELRLYPAQALMTTYTYNGFGSITSQCDADNRITSYEYDSMGKLLYIRDQDRNILKNFDYEYQH